MALEEQLSLDIQDALNSVGQLETALTSAASLFASSLTEALSVLDSLQVGTVDASAVTADIDAAVAAADLAPVVTADASSVTDDIDSAVAAVDAQVTPTTDAEGITADIDAAVAAADASVTPTVDTGSIVEEIDTAVAAADPVITPTVDTSGAVSEIDSLSSSASGATGSVSGLGGATEGFAAAAALGRGEVQGLADGVGGIGAGAVPAVAGIAALGATTAFLFNAAADSAQAEEQFARSLGSVAAEVKNVDIGGLNEDLQALAQRTGNDDEALLRASAHIAELGKSAGATQPQIAETAKQIDVLAIRATTLDPALGQAGDVADRMTAAFARGGRALVPFHIALTTAEINARALTDTGKSTAAELTLFEKSAAGAALTTEKLGDHLGKDINEGAKSAQVQIRSLKEEFQNAIEALGTPLLDPVVRSLREAQPFLITVASDFGHLAEAVLPLFAKGIEAIGPLVGGASVAFGLLVDVIAPVVDLITAIPTPILTMAAAFALLGPAGSLLVTTFFAIGGAVEALGAALTALATNPVALAAIGIGVLVNMFLAQGKAADEAKKANQAYADELGNVEKSVEQVTQDEIAKRFKTQAEAVTAVGSSFEALTGQVLKGKAGFDSLLDTLQLNSKLTQDARDRISEYGISVSNSAEKNKFLLNETRGLDDATRKLIVTFLEEQKAAQNGAKTKLEQIAAENAHNATMVAGAERTHLLTDGTIDYSAALQAVKPRTTDVTEATKASTAAYQLNAKEIKALDDALNKFIDTELASVDKGLAAEQAQRHVADAARALTVAEKAAADATAAHGAQSDEARVANLALKDAEDAVIGSASSLAQKNLDAANATATLNGTTVTAAEKQHIIDAAFNQVAGTLAEGSPLRTRLEGTKQNLDNIAGTYTATVQVDAGNAEAVLANLTRQFDLMTAAQQRAGTVLDLSGTDPHLLDGIQRRMAGGPVTADHPYVVGETEPELFVPSVSGFVLNQAQIAAIVAASRPPTPTVTSVAGSPVVQNVTVNEVAHDPRATAFAVSSRIGVGARR